MYDDFQSCDSHVAMGNHLRHLRKKKQKKQETSAYFVFFKKKWVTHIGSTVDPSSSSLEII